MSVSDIFQQFQRASATLQQHFPNAPAIALETVSQYNSSHLIPDLQWLQLSLPQLADELSSSPPFTLKLEIGVAGYKVISNIERVAGNLTLSGHEVDDSALSTASLSDPTKLTLKEFSNFFTDKAQAVDLNTVVQQATGLTGQGLAVDLKLDLYLDKGRLNRDLANAAASDVTANIVSYLFQAQLKSKLANTTVDRFETEFLIAGKPTVFLVFDLAGGLASDFITVCGQDQHDLVEALLTRALPDETLIRAEQVREFRRSQSFGNFAPRWLIPEFVALTVTRGDPNDTAELKRDLQRFQPVLAAIFMGDFVEVEKNGIYSVDYRGLHPKRFQLDNAQFNTQEQHWPSLYKLYQYAYDGVSGDKLEIVQQFISQFADDASMLCAKASEIRESTKKTHDRTLVVRVQEYFAARQSVQERIQTAIEELTHDMITLSREVSADVYKVLGVIALAIAGSFFKTDIGIIALLLGFLTIAIYLLIVVFYHLPTLKSATDLRKSQHDAYINSFEDVLTEAELEKFRINPNWATARTSFENKLWWTKAIYLTFGLITLAAAIGIFIHYYVSTPAIPPITP
ncbi:MAG TPA: hypothetical protein VFS76_12015 [Pyrinomonadaceae bacterium]|nr:hypothetical protein [Pyrinomonadaceae bacterium]